MGEVISIRRSTDDDLYTLFSQTCPEVPAEVDEKVQLAASRALGGNQVQSSQPSFKTVCLVVAGACLIGITLVRGVTDRWNNAVDSAARYSVQSSNLNKEAVLGAALPLDNGPPDNSSLVNNSENSWRRSRGAWAEYIARLERDPFYQYVLQEKMRFEAQYPGKP